MMKQVLDESLKRQEAVMNQEQLERALGAMQVEFAAAEASAEQVRGDVLLHRREMRDR
jgi:hypothetical protein